MLSTKALTDARARLRVYLPALGRLFVALHSCVVLCCGLCGSTRRLHRASRLISCRLGLSHGCGHFILLKWTEGARHTRDREHGTSISKVCAAQCCALTWALSFAAAARFFFDGIGRAGDDHARAQAVDGRRAAHARATVLGKKLNRKKQCHCLRRGCAAHLLGGVAPALFVCCLIRLAGGRLGQVPRLEAHRGCSSGVG